MKKLRLPAIYDFDDPRLIDEVILPLQQAAKKRGSDKKDIAEQLINSIYGYVERRWKAHVTKLVRKGITNIAHEAILSELNNRLARSIVTIDWKRSPKEIRGYILQQINYGLKEADRNSGKRSRREHRHVSKAAVLISRREQLEGRALNRTEITEVVSSCIPDTSKTKWQDIVQMALDNGEGPTKKNTLGEDNALEISGTHVAEISTDLSAEESWFAAARMETLTRILGDWIQNDLSEQNKQSVSEWLEQQNTSEFRPGRKRKNAPLKVLSSITEYEKKCLYDRCSQAGLEEVQEMFAARFFEKINAEELKWSELFSKIKKYDLGGGVWMAKCHIEQLQEIAGIQISDWKIKVPDLKDERTRLLFEVCRTTYQVLPDEAVIYSTGRVDLVDREKRVHIDFFGEEECEGASEKVRNFFSTWEIQSRKSRRKEELLLPF